MPDQPPTDEMRRDHVTGPELDHRELPASEARGSMSDEQLSPVAVVEIMCGLHKGHICRLDKEITTVGRSPDCDLSLLGEMACPRLHAQFLRDGNTWFVEDLNSRCGTRVNGIQTIERTRLRDGDTVQITTVLLTFRTPFPG